MMNGKFNKGDFLQHVPFVSVIVLNYNGLRFLEEGLKECLDSVLMTNYPNFEVIFVDNGSTDSSVDFIRKNFKSIKVIKNDYNLGFSEGFNRGIKVSKGKYLALLSNDMIVDRAWLKAVIKLMESEPQIGIASFKRIVYGTKNLLDGIGGNLYLCGRARPVGAFEIDIGQYSTAREDLDYIGGGIVIRRKTLEEVGLFDSDYIIFSEDVDLCYRVRKRGYKTVYVPNALTWHRGQVTLKGMDPTGWYTNYMASRSRIRFVLIHFTFMRILSTFLIDLVWLFLANSTNKKSLLKAYWWNLLNVSTALKKRLLYGPSPPFGCKFPVTPFQLADLLRRLREIMHKVG